ncbi:hypothetical protein J3Q64DRAFT_1321764 [Phycomyces blakesleeanus]|uniref:Uncharacterized protein n=1 Tax=Phycomyces blakesleeanus TaxID=4837 RepID=A0ABR3B7N0_PHYBL
MKPYIKLVTLFALVLLGFLLYAVFPPDYGVDSNNHDAYHQDHTNHPDTPPPVPPPNNVPASPPNPFVPPPPPPPRYPPDVVKEATLGPCPLFQNQPLQQPKPIVPASQPVSVDNLAPIAPTADQTTIRLNTAKSLDYARPNELWQFSVVRKKRVCVCVINRERKENDAGQ